MSRNKWSKSPAAPYHDDPDQEEDFGLVGNDLDRHTLASKAQDVVRLDNMEKAAPNGRRRISNNITRDTTRDTTRDLQGEAILQDAFAARSGGEVSPRCKQIVLTLAVAALIILSLVFKAVERVPAMFVLSACLAALTYATNMTITLLERDTGTARMKQVAGFIQQGAQGFFRTQFAAIAGMAFICCGLLFVGFLFRPASADVKVSPFVLACITCVSFVCGATCSCFAGFVGLWISVRTNVRVASAARRSYVEAIQTAMRGGMIAALIVVALAVFGVMILYLVFEEVFVGWAEVATHPNEVPLLLVGYGFGASFVALFAQLGGGIFTKAADVGADLVGKVEAGIPEDDPRNPAVIADLVGDNVGDCAGRGADLFESIAAEIISAMILGGTMATRARVIGTGFVMFPLVVHAFDLIISSIGWWTVAMRPHGSPQEGSAEHGTPLAILNRGFYTAGALSVVTFGMACRWLLYVETAPNAWWHFYICGLIGMCACYLSVTVSTYYTATEYTPVRDIAEASKSGHATYVLSLSLSLSLFLCLLLLFIFGTYSCFIVCCVSFAM